MTGTLAEAALTAFLIFCRVGSCLILIPGYSSARVPVLVRLALALAIALALTPMLYAMVSKTTSSYAEAYRPLLAVNEVMAGGVIGLMARLQLLGLQFAAIVAANAIGLAGLPGIPIDEGEAMPPLAQLMSLAGVMMLFATGLHIEAIRAIVESYGALPMRMGLDTGWYLEQTVKSVAETSLTALRLAGPFIVYAVTINFALGLANKFAPQISLYFASLGLVTAGGLAVMALLAPEWLALFADSYGAWLSGGSR
ncbi:MAG: flagellar biosynthetic protein FliR [Rhizobiales bacterium]|nr:flagellar biosynthetic protein FliR [Hyphomicrobiales bacterium]MBI3672779.1 flagellar biosynthetic protein FliR [Hyphomicrobiales bacterium]